MYLHNYAVFHFFYNEDLGLTISTHQVICLQSGELNEKYNLIGSSGTAENLVVLWLVLFEVIKLPLEAFSVRGISDLIPVTPQKYPLTSKQGQVDIRIIIYSVVFVKCKVGN